MNVSTPAVSCPVCAALPPDRTSEIRWPAPVAQDEWVHDDRVRGALLGLAIGDALGGLRRSGEKLPADLVPGALVTGGATQLGLFTTEALIRMYVRVQAKGIGPAWAVIRHGLDRWMFTQGRPPHPIFGPQGDDWPDGWLVRQHRLHRRIDGFDATVSALNSEMDPAEGLVDRHVPPTVPNTSTGAGAIVRVAGAGLVARPKDAFLVGAIASAYTHGAADAYLAGAALARIVAGLVDGDPIGGVLNETREELSRWPGGDAIRAALASPGGKTTSSATRALAAGVEYLSLPDSATPIAAIAHAISRGGTAAGVTTGVVIGARHGASAFPSGWSVAPDIADIVEEVARATSAADRAWAMDRDLPGYSELPDGAFEDPSCALFWPRFPGW